MIEKPILLDTFCKAGGATKGYQCAGFYVVGVDIEDQPHYIGDDFIKGDAIEFIRTHGHLFDAIHASPPCQHFSCQTPMAYRDNHPDLIAPTRNAIKETGKPYVIENVPGARRSLVNPIMLCGSSFDIGVFRHRYFELGGFDILMLPPCCHNFKPVYISGSTGSSKSPKGTRKEWNAADKRNAIDIDWMTVQELDEAIPPVYTEFIGRHLIQAIKVAVD